MIRKQKPAEMIEERYEPIKARALELLDLALTGLKQGDIPIQQRAFLSSITPMMTMMLQKMPEERLISWLECLSEIGRAVCDLDSSPEAYQETVIPLIQRLAGSHDKN